MGLGDDVSGDRLDEDSFDAAKCVGNYVVFAAYVLKLGGELCDERKLVHLDRRQFVVALREGEGERLVVSLDGAVLRLEDVTEV